MRWHVSGDVAAEAVIVLPHPGTFAVVHVVISDGLICAFNENPQRTTRYTAAQPHRRTDVASSFGNDLALCSIYAAGAADLVPV